MTLGELIEEMRDSGMLRGSSSYYPKGTTVLEKIRDTLSLDVDEQGWFQNIKDVAEAQGFAIDRKAYKANPEAFKGQVGDVAEMLRVALTGRKNTPTLYYVMKVLGEENSKNRLSKVISSLTK